MSQLRLRHFEWFSCLAEKRGMQVTQAVPTHSRDGCSTTRRVDNPPKQVVSAQRRPPPRWEKQIVGAALSDALRMCEQGSQHDVSQWKVTNAAPSFRWAKLPPVNTLAHLEDATLKVDVTPPQCKQLALIPVKAQSRTIVRTGSGSTRRSARSCSTVITRGGRTSCLAGSRIPRAGLEVR